MVYIYILNNIPWQYVSKTIDEEITFLNNRHRFLLHKETLLYKSYYQSCVLFKISNHNTLFCLFLCLGHVTKIELELEEAPDDMILVGSMPSELDVTGETNSTYPDGELKNLTKDWQPSLPVIWKSQFVSLF